MLRADPYSRIRSTATAPSRPDRDSDDGRAHPELAPARNTLPSKDALPARECRKNKPPPIGLGSLLEPVLGPCLASTRRPQPSPLLEFLPEWNEPELLFDRV